MLPEAAIKVFPRNLAQGALPAHYRKGWEEKARQGESLIGEQVRLPVRGFEGTTAGRSATETVVAPATPPPPVPDVPVSAPGKAGSLNSRWKP